MHPYMASALAAEHHRELTGLAGRRHATARPRGPRRRAPHACLSRVLVPRCRVTWPRTALAPAGVPGRRGRSWVIVISVISATRGR